jgi:pyruvate dehydrogenase E2 component (dihydrolipoamide acetyltransferase)
MAEFLMPKLGADMNAGTLVAWQKKPGDRVRRGDVIAEVETEKGNIDVEVFTDGIVEDLKVHPGTRVPVGTVLATIRNSTATAPPELAATEIAVTPTTVPTAIPRAAPAGLPTGARLVITPLARRRARELGVDPTLVHGSGFGGAITLEDIERAAAAKVATPSKRAAPSTVDANMRAEAADRAARLRQTISAAMARSKREIPHYYLATTIDMHRAVTWLAEQNERRPVADRLLYGVLVLKAVALALRKVPELNGTWEQDRFVPGPGIHLGVAVALRQGGLIAPALHNADAQSIDELMANFRDLVNRARAGSLRSSELSDATITITSLGEQGVETVYGVIYPPQTAIVGVGKVVTRPWVVEQQVVARPLIQATLAADHRVTDGHKGALFLAELDRLLQEPDKL